jgi:hypothetical protein
MGERFCYQIGCDGDGNHKCSGCDDTFYCSKSCQKNSWPSHKPNCQMSQDIKKLAKLDGDEFFHLYKKHGQLTDEILIEFIIKKYKFCNEEFVLSQLKQTINPSYFMRTYDIAREAHDELRSTNEEYAANSKNKHVVRKEYSHSILERSKCTTCFNIFENCCCKSSSKSDVLIGMGLSVLGDMATFDEKTREQLKIEHTLNKKVVQELLFEPQSSNVRPSNARSSNGREQKTAARLAAKLAAKKNK